LQQVQVQVQVPAANGISLEPPNAASLFSKIEILNFNFFIFFNNFRINNYFSSSDLQHVHVQVQVLPERAISPDPPNEASLFSKTEMLSFNFFIFYLFIPQDHLGFANL
jgi:hypothetical protein